MASDLRYIRKAEDAAAAPYKGAIGRADGESVLNKDAHLRKKRLAASSKMINFIWFLIRQGQRDLDQLGNRVLEWDYRYFQPVLTSSGEPLVFLEFYFGEQKQKRARKGNYRLLQRIIASPFPHLNLYLLAGITTAQEEALFAAELTDSLISVGFVPYG